MLESLNLDEVFSMECDLQLEQPIHAPHIGISHMFPYSCYSSRWYVFLLLINQSSYLINHQVIYDVI